jgi:beta-phosphoglucomutase family hydrolase
VLGLPDQTKGCLFDLDGVLTPTAKVHSAAWKQMFDGFLRDRAEREGSAFEEFTASDYAAYVDGKPRADGIRSFLGSREIEIPDGEPDDGPEQETVNGLGARKNALFTKVLGDDGVDAYPGSVRYVDAAIAAGHKCAVVSSSANCRPVLEAAGIIDRFDAIVDGKVARRDELKGKPAPDTFLAGAKALGLDPGACAVYEDALAGVEAGAAGDFGIVIGVNRADQAEALAEHGADVVVDDLEELIES